MRQRPRLDWQTERCDGVMAELKVWGDSYRTTSLRTISSVPPAKPSSSLLQSVPTALVALDYVGTAAFAAYATQGSNPRRADPRQVCHSHV